MKLLIPKSLKGKVGNSIFTKDQMPNKKVLSLWKERFMECADPTEYRFGISSCGDFQVYEQLKHNSKFLREALVGWKKELRIKLRSDSMQTIIEDVKAGSKSSLNSAKYLEEKFEKESMQGIKATQKKHKAKVEERDKVWDSIKDSYKLRVAK